MTILCDDCVYRDPCDFKQPSYPNAHFCREYISESDAAVENLVFAADEPVVDGAWED